MPVLHRQHPREHPEPAPKHLLLRQNFPRKLGPAPDDPVLVHLDRLVEIILVLDLFDHMNNQIPLKMRFPLILSDVTIRKFHLRSNFLMAFALEPINPNLYFFYFLLCLLPHPS